MSSQLLNFDWRVVSVIGSDSVSNLPGTSSGGNGIPLLQLTLELSAEQDSNARPSSFARVAGVDGEQVLPTSNLLLEMQLPQLEDLIVCLYGAHQQLAEAEKREADEADQ